MVIVIFQRRTVKNIIHFNSSIKWIALGIEIGKSKDFERVSFLKLLSIYYFKLWEEGGRGGMEGWEEREKAEDRSKISWHL